MKKLSLSFVLLLSTSSLCHAGFLDSLLNKESQKVTTQAPSEADSTITAVTNASMSLIPQLVKQLGVTDTQAEGGMGALFQVAKSKLTSDEFSELDKEIPEMKTLLTVAPNLKPKANSSNLSGTLSGLGGLASSIGDMSQLTEQFETLGLSPDMIGQFATVAIEYFSSDSSEDSTSSLLQKGLSSILK